MTNLKKSLILLVTLGNMQQLVPMLGTTTDSKPPVTASTSPRRMIGGQGGVYHGTKESQSVTSNETTSSSVVDSKPTPNVRITGLKQDETGLYDSQNNTAILMDGKTVTIYTHVVPVSKAIRHNMPKGAVPFATMPNPKFTGHKMGGETKNITLYGVVQTHQENNDHESMFGAHGGGVFRGITIYGFKAGVTGLYDRQTRMANVGGAHYTVTSEYRPLHAGTMVPREIGGANLIAYMEDNAEQAAQTTVKVGAPSTKVYLYGRPAESNIVS